jgi:methionine-rich copper-binding protein CopC
MSGHGRTHPGRAVSPRQRTGYGVILVVLAVALTSPPPADGHARLLRAEPAPGSRVTTPPRIVRAWFDDELDPKHSTLVVTDRRGRRVDDGRGGVDLDDLDRKSMLARLRPIGPGVYTVVWQAVSADDKYVARGRFRFTVAP